LNSHLWRVTKRLPQATLLYLSTPKPPFQQRPSTRGRWGEVLGWSSTRRCFTSSTRTKRCSITRSGYKRRSFGTSSPCWNPQAFYQKCMWLLGGVSSSSAEASCRRWRGCGGYCLGHRGWYDKRFAHPRPSSPRGVVSISEQELGAAVAIDTHQPAHAAPRDGVWTRLDSTLVVPQEGVGARLELCIDVH